MISDIPKGKLLIIGGAEDTGGKKKPAEGGDEESRNFEHFELLRELLPPETRKEHRIEVITTASEEPHEMGNKYKAAFEKAEIGNVGILHIGNRDEAKSKPIIDRVKKASAVFFSGGDQFRISTILGCTEITDIIIEKYN